MVVRPNPDPLIHAERRHLLTLHAKPDATTRLSVRKGGQVDLLSTASLLLCSPSAPPPALAQRSLPKPLDSARCCQSGGDATEYRRDDMRPG